MGVVEVMLNADKLKAFRITSPHVSDAVGCSKACSQAFDGKSIA